jgi:hypothetical protein
MDLIECVRVLGIGAWERTATENPCEQGHYSEGLFTSKQASHTASPLWRPAVCRAAEKAFTVGLNLAAAASRMQAFQAIDCRTSSPAAESVAIQSTKAILHRYLQEKLARRSGF